MDVKHVLSVLIAILLISTQASSQDFIKLHDVSGAPATTTELVDLEAQVQEVLGILPSAYQSSFKVYDCGFYSHNEDFQGGFDGVWETIIANVENRPESDYYLILGREAGQEGINSKIRVELKLPDVNEFDCFDETKSNNVERYLEAAANALNEGSNVYQAEIEALNLLQLYIYKIVNCECTGVRADCSLSGEYRLIDPELLALGFRKKEIEVGYDCAWTNGDQGIYDYFGKEVIIDGKAYCLTDQIREGKAIIDAPQQVLPDTTINTSIVGKVYILDNESWRNDEWTAALAEASDLNNDYIEYWVIVKDEFYGKYYLYSKFTFGELAPPVAFSSQGESTQRVGVTLSPMGAALKILGNAAVDAIMQGVMQRIINRDVRSKPTEAERWETAFGEVSYLGALWEGISSLIPWKKDLVSTIVRTATSALAVVVDKARQPNYTVSQGFMDFAVGFAASGLTQMIGGQVGNIGRRIISKGMDDWYEKTSITVLRRIIFSVSRIYDDFVEDVVLSAKYIDQNVNITGIRRIDLMGGNSTQLTDDFINVDLRGSITKGVKGDATKLGQFIPHASIDEVVCSNPYLDVAFNAEDYLSEVAKVLEPGKRFYLNGNNSNPYFRDVTESLAIEHGFSVEVLKQPLLPRFHSLTFFQSDLVTPVPVSSIKSTVLVKL